MNIDSNFSVFIHFLKIQFINTSNLILLGFKVSSESFFPKFLKTAFTFCGFENCKIGSERVSISMGHPVQGGQGIGSNIYDCQPKPRNGHL